MVFFLLTRIYAFSQNDTISKNQTKHPLFALKIAPLCLIEPTPSFEIAVEYAIKQQWSLQQQIGYMNARLGVFDLHVFGYEYNELKGIRLRTEAKYYFRKAKFDEHPYLAADVLYKCFSDSKEEYYFRYNASYTEKIATKRKNQVFALHLKIGAIKYFYSKFFFDIYVGIGIRRKDITKQGLPKDAEPTVSDFRFYDDAGYWLGSMTGGVKLGVKIK